MLRSRGVVYKFIMEQSKVKARLSEPIGWLKEELNNIRVGRATTDMVSGIKVEAYEGTILPLQEVATMTAPEPNQLLIQPWDQSVLPAVEKALAEQRERFSVSVSENAVRVSLPPLSEERRKELTRMVGEKVEEARIRMRNIRDAVRREIKSDEEESLISEDEEFRYLDKVDELAKEVDAQIKELGERKKNEIMS